MWQCSNKKGQEWCGDCEDLNRMLQLGGKWRKESKILVGVLGHAGQALSKRVGGDVAGTRGYCLTWCRGLYE